LNSTAGATILINAAVTTESIVSNVTTWCLDMHTSSPNDGAGAVSGEFVV